MALAEVAEVLRQRRECIQRENLRSRALTPGQDVARVVRRFQFVILSRVLQQEVFDQIFFTWIDEYGQPHLAELHRLGKCKTEPQVLKALLGYFRTHCDKVFGGQLWLRFLIALGRVPKQAIDATNDVIQVRVQFKRHEWASLESRPVDSHHFLRREDRADARASTPGGDGTGALAPPPGTVHPRTQRRTGQRQRKRLLQEQDDGIWEEEKQEFERRMAEVEAKLDAADQASWEHGFPFKDKRGQWQLVNNLSPKSLFEESFYRTLLEVGFSQSTADFLTSSEGEEEENRKKDRQAERAQRPSGDLRWVCASPPGRGGGRGGSSSGGYGSYGSRRSGGYGGGYGGHGRADGGGYRRGRGRGGGGYGHGGGYGPWW